MAEFNSCAHLLNETDVKKAKELYHTLLSQGDNPMELVFSIQKKLQDKLADKLGRIPYIEDIKTKGQLYDWLIDQKTAIDDEFRELLDAVAGMEKSEKDRSAIWKKWKSNHDEIRAEKLDDMSDFEKKELLFEKIDILHFVVNCMLALGITPEDMFVMYYIKNAENFARQERGY